MCSTLAQCRDFCGFFPGFGELLVSRAFLMDFVRHAACFDGFCMADVSSVSIEFLSRIAFFDKGFEFLRTPTRSGGAGYHIVTNELCPLVSFDMVLIAVEIHLVFLGPASIPVFLAKLVGLGFPYFRGLALLDLPVLFACVALPGNLPE